MSRTLEAHMIEPVRSLMHRDMRLDTTAKEFNAGYGIADLVGAVLCRQACWIREKMGFTTALDHNIIHVLSTLDAHTRTSHAYILRRIPLSENTILKKILPRMAALGLIERFSDGYVQLAVELPKPTERIVAIEVKQTNWREAILQARRYTFFADQTYVALWNGATRLVDRKQLYYHRLGLIGVEQDCAQVLVEAPLRKPRQPQMNRFCAEFLYAKALFTTHQASCGLAV